MEDIIYLDNNGTTNMSADVRYAMSIDIRGNASSTGIYGEKANNIMTKCKQIIADHFGVDPEKYQIIFTSGASESNNSIINSAVNMHIKYKKSKDIPIVISTLYEHKTSHDCLNNLEEFGKCKIIQLKPNSRGLIEPSDLLNLFKYLTHIGSLQRVCLVTIMHVNNEIGSKNAINQIGNICKQFNVPLHSDIVQSIKFNRVNMDLLDAISVSFHKFGGPKSVGLLIFNKKIFTRYLPLVCGSQQDGFRGGTENVNLIFGSTIALMNNARDRELKNIRIEIIRNEMLKILSSYFDTFYYHELDMYKHKINMSKPTAIIFGPRNKEWRNPNTIYFAISGGKQDTFNNDIVIKALNEKQIIISKGSTCNSKTLKPSSALAALKVKQCLLSRSFRISLGDENLNYPEKTINAMHDVCKTIINLIYSSYKYHTNTHGQIV